MGAFGFAEKAPSSKSVILHDSLPSLAWVAAYPHSPLTGTQHLVRGLHGVSLSPTPCVHYNLDAQTIEHPFVVAEWKLKVRNMRNVAGVHGSGTHARDNASISRSAGARCP